MPLCSRILVDGELHPFTPQRRSAIVAAQKQWPSRACASSPSPTVPGAGVDREALEQDLVWAGLVAAARSAAAGSPDALRKCHEAGIRVIMATGDHPRTALAIAREVGLVQSASRSVITGETLRHLPRSS